MRIVYFVNACPYLKMKLRLEVLKHRYQFGMLLIESELYIIIIISFCSLVAVKQYCTIFHSVFQSIWVYNLSFVFQLNLFEHKDNQKLNNVLLRFIFSSHKHRFEIFLWELLCDIGPWIPNWIIKSANAKR